MSSIKTSYLNIINGHEIFIVVSHILSGTGQNRKILAHRYKIQSLF